jgi:hypothetical protein
MEKDKREIELEKEIFCQLNKKRPAKKEVYKLLYSIALEAKGHEKSNIVKALAYFFQVPKNRKTVEDQSLAMFKKHGKDNLCDSHKLYQVESGLAYCTDRQSALRWPVALADGFYCTKTHFLIEKPSRSKIPLDSIKQVLKDQEVFLYIEEFRQSLIDHQIFYYHPELEKFLFSKEIFDVVSKIDGKCSMAKNGILFVTNEKYSFVTVGDCHS